MLRRITRLALATVAAVVVSQAPIAATTPVANAAGLCSLLTVPFAGAYAGATVEGQYEQWHTTASAGQTTITLRTNSYYSYLGVYDSNCWYQYCYTSYGSYLSCTVDSTENLNIVVGNMYGETMTYTLTAVPGVPRIPAECEDGIDNDLNGTRDYPNDPGCYAPYDTDESSPPQACSPILGAPTCVVIQNGTVYQQVTAYGPRTVVDATHTVVGTVDVYRFPLPTGGAVTAPCVVLTVNTVGSNGCALAGGTYVTRLATLVNQAVQQPGARLDVTLATARICRATYTVTVSAIGIEQFPAYSIC